MNLEIEKLRIEDGLTQDSSDESQGQGREKANLKSHRRISTKYLCVGGILMFLTFTSLFLYMDPSKKSDVIDFNKHPFLALTSHTDPDFKWDVFVDIPSRQVFLVKESSLSRSGAGSRDRRRLLSASDTNNFDESKVTQVILHKFNQDHITLYRLVEGKGIHTQCSQIPVASGFELTSQLKELSEDDDWDGMPLSFLLKTNAMGSKPGDDDYDGMPPSPNETEFLPLALVETESSPSWRLELPNPKIDHEKIRRSSEQEEKAKEEKKSYSLPDMGPDVIHADNPNYRRPSEQERKEKEEKKNEKKSHLLSELGHGDRMNQRPDAYTIAEHEKAKNKTKLSISIKVAEPFDINRIKTKLSEAGECPICTLNITDDSKTILHSSEFWDRIPHHEKMDREDIKKILEKEGNNKKKENVHGDEKYVKEKKDSAKEDIKDKKENVKEDAKDTKQENEDGKKEDLQRLVVLGATGNVGLPIVKNAIGRKIRVLAVSLDAEAKLELEDKNLELATLNLTKESALSDVLYSNDTVIFCALSGQTKEHETMFKTAYEVFEKKGIKRVVNTGGNAQMKNEKGVRYFETEEIKKTMPPLWIETAKAQEKVLKKSKLDWTEVDFGTVLPGSKTPESGTANTFLGEESRLIEFEEVLQDVEVLTIPVMGSYVMEDVLAEKIVDIASKKVYLKQHIAIHSGVFAPKSTEKHAKI